MNALDRFNDLQKQGFMRPRKARKPATVRPMVACNGCLNWHPKGKHTADRATRAATLMGSKLVQRPIAGEV